MHRKQCFRTSNIYGAVWFSLDTVTEYLLVTIIKLIKIQTNTGKAN